MNPRHAAALALVGWYLMVPQVKGDAKSGYRADYDAPGKFKVPLTLRSSQKPPNLRRIPYFGDS
jgi:hypothetical protein